MGDDKGSPSANVELGESLLRACVEDGRSETLETFEGLSAEERDALAVDAWTVGLRALSNAYREARESRLQDIGKSVLEDMDTQLKSMLALQEKQLRDALAQFFDPSSGEVTRRLKDFVDDRGELARFLEKHIGVEDSTLAKTLARQVGENSELFKKLSPTDKEGLIHVLEERLGEVMASSEQQVARALDPMAEDSPVSRFLKSLQERLKNSRAESGGAAYAGAQGYRRE